MITMATLTGRGVGGPGTKYADFHKKNPFRVPEKLFRTILNFERRIFVGKKCQGIIKSPLLKVVSSK